MTIWPYYKYSKNEDIHSFISTPSPNWPTGQPLVGTAKEIAFIIFDIFSKRLSSSGMIYGPNVVIYSPICVDFSDKKLKITTMCTWPISQEFIDELNIELMRYVNLIAFI